MVNQHSEIIHFQNSPMTAKLITHLLQMTQFKKDYIVTSSLEP